LSFAISNIQSKIHSSFYLANRLLQSRILDSASSAGKGKFDIYEGEVLALAGNTIFSQKKQL